MDRAQLAGLIRNGENSGVDLKRDDLTPNKVAKVAAAYASGEPVSSSHERVRMLTA